MTNQRKRVLEALEAEDNKEDVFKIVAAALRLERALYAKEKYGPYLFRLRKALEGIWGHELPELDEFGDEIPTSN